MTNQLTDYAAGFYNGWIIAVESIANVAGLSGLPAHKSRVGLSHA